MKDERVSIQEADESEHTQLESQSLSGGRRVWRRMKVMKASNSLRPHGLQLARLLCPWNSPGQNTGVGSHSLLQGIFPTQGLNPDSLPSEPPGCRSVYIYV